MSKSCLICDRINKIKKNTNPYFIVELKTGYVVFDDHQFFKGYVLFLCKQHKTELYELDIGYKKKILIEMSMVAEAVFRAFQPEKLNYELLGNKDPHLHWHIIPRYRHDSCPQRTIWTINKSARNSDKYYPSKAELKKMKRKFIRALRAVQ